jgi:hypothetical protein
MINTSTVAHQGRWGVHSITVLDQGTPFISVERVKDILMAQRRSCKVVSTCEEAVEM